MKIRTRWATSEEREPEREILRHSPLIPILKSKPEVQGGWKDPDRFEEI